MELQPGHHVDDRYVVEDFLGSGGVALVYRVRHTRLGTLHALKRIANHTPSVRERLLSEGRAQGSLRHPNLVAVTDVVDLDGWPALVLEYVDGPALDQLKKQVPLSLDQVDALVRGILDGVAHAHARHFVHRDLKPSNILCALDDHGLTPKVADFGLVKCLDPSLTDEGGSFTRTGATLGTPAYMAPEQIRSARDIDARADVWALGVLCYELLCGVRPFQGPDPFSVQQAAIAGDRLPVRERVPEAPERMVRAIDAALQTDPADRPADAAALRALWVDGTDAPTEVWTDLPVERWERDHAPRSTGSGSETLDVFATDPDLGKTTPAPTLQTADRAPVPAAPAPAEESLITSRWLTGGAALMLAGAVLFALGRMPYEPVATSEAPREAALQAPDTIPELDQPEGTPFAFHDLRVTVPPGWTTETKWTDKDQYDIARIELKDGRGNSVFVHDFRPRTHLTLAEFSTRWTAAFYDGLEKKGMTVTESEVADYTPAPFLGSETVAGIRHRATRKNFDETVDFRVDIAVAETPDHELFVTARYQAADADRLEPELERIRASLSVDPQPE